MYPPLDAILLAQMLLVGINWFGCNDPSSCFVPLGGNGAFSWSTRPGQVAPYIFELPADRRMCSDPTGLLQIVRKEQFRKQLTLLYGGDELLFMWRQSQEPTQDIPGIFDEFCSDGLDTGPGEESLSGRRFWSPFESATRH